MATIDDVYAQNVTILANLATLQTDINTLKTDVTSIKNSVTTINTNVNTVDDKIDILSGDTTSTNVLDKVLGIERRTKAMEFKLMKGR